MATALDRASLDPLERRTLERFVEMLRERLGEELVAVWLYGSRARGEEPHPESDVDLIVITRGGERDRKTTIAAVWDAAEVEGSNPFNFSAHTFDPEYVEDRRAIESFYIQEVDRDKIVMYGSAL